MINIAAEQHQQPSTVYLLKISLHTLLYTHACTQTQHTGTHTHTPVHKHRYTHTHTSTHITLRQWEGYHTYAHANTLAHKNGAVSKRQGLKVVESEVVAKKWL